MSFPYTADVLAAITRLLTYYNSGNYNVSTNPGGLGLGGHRVNFNNMCQDVALVTQAVSDAATASGVSATAASAYATAAAAAATKLTATSATSVAMALGSQAFVTQADKLFAVGSFVQIRSAANPTTNFMQGQVTAYSGTALTVNVLVVTGSGTFADWQIQLAASPGQIGPTGATGPSGVTPNIQMTFSSGTGDSDPGNGLIKLNNATVASVTQIYIDNLDRFGTSISAFVATFDASTNAALRGQFKMTQAGDPSKYAIFNITAATTAGSGYQKLNVVYAAGPGGFDNGAYVVIDFTRTGDKGLDGIGAGDVVGPSTVTDNHVAVFDGTTGKRIKSGGALAAVAFTPSAANITFSPSGGLSSVTAQAAITELDTEKQPIDAMLSALAALTTAADKALYFTGPDLPALFDTTSVTRGLMALTSISALRQALVLSRAEDGAALGLLTNPFMEVSQESGTTAVSVTATAKYGPDQWTLGCTGSVVASIAQVAAPFAVDGYRRFQNATKVTITTAQASMGSADEVRIEQPIEGTYLRNLGLGGNDAVPFTLFYVVQSSVSGDFCFYAQNAARDRTWVKKVTLVANTPQVVVVPISALTSGTWPTTNAVAAYVGVTLATGSTLQTTSLDAWNSDAKRGHASALNLAATVNATFQIAYCNAFPASVLPFTSPSDAELLPTLAMLRRPFEQEQLRCERYFSKYSIGIRGYTTTGIYMEATIQHRVPCRTIPTITVDTSGAQFNAMSALSKRTGTTSYTVFNSANTSGSPADGIAVDMIAILNARM